MQWLCLTNPEPDPKLAFINSASPDVEGFSVTEQPTPSRPGVPVRGRAEENHSFPVFNGARSGFVRFETEGGGPQRRASGQTTVLSGTTFQSLYMWRWWRSYPIHWGVGRNGITMAHPHPHATCSVPQDTL